MNGQWSNVRLKADVKVIEVFIVVHSHCFFDSTSTNWRSMKTFKILSIFIKLDLMFYFEFRHFPQKIYLNNYNEESMPTTIRGLLFRKSFPQTYKFQLLNV